MLCTAHSSILQAEAQESDGKMGGGGCKYALHLLKRRRELRAQTSTSLYVFLSGFWRRRVLYGPRRTTDHSPRLQAKSAKFVTVVRLKIKYTIMPPRSLFVGRCTLWVETITFTYQYLVCSTCSLPRSKKKLETARFPSSSEKMWRHLLVRQKMYLI